MPMSGIEDGSQR